MLDVRLEKVTLVDYIKKFYNASNTGMQPYSARRLRHWWSPSALVKVTPLPVLLLFKLRRSITLLRF